MQTSTLPASAGRPLNSWSMSSRLSRSAGLMTISLAGLLSGCGGGGNGTGTASPIPVETAPEQSPIAAVKTISPGNWVVIGSSTAAGYGASSGKGWVALLQAKWSGKGAVLVNTAKAGIVTYEALSSTSSPVANRPRPDPAVNIDQALARKPVLLIVAFPANDTVSGYSTDETISNLLAIRAQALAASVPVIVISSQPRSLPAPKQAQLLAIDERMASAAGGCFVKVHASLAGPGDALAAAFDSGDGAHPNDAGHSVIANAIDAVLRGEGCVRVAG